MRASSLGTSGGLREGMVFEMWALMAGGGSLFCHSEDLFVMTMERSLESVIMRLKGPRDPVQVLSGSY